MMPGFLIIIFVILPVSLLSVVIVHETGHLLGGKLSHYRFVFICFFNVVIYERNGLRLTRKRCHGPGQCIMWPEGGNTGPVLMIIGGIFANISVGAAFLVIAAYSECGYLKMFFYINGIMNVMVAISNFLPSASHMNDGDTFREVTRRKDSPEAYNRVMQICSGLFEGHSFHEMSRYQLGDISDGKGSLYGELSLYNYYILCDRLGYVQECADALYAELNRLYSFPEEMGIKRDVAVELLIHQIIYEHRVDDACMSICRISEGEDSLRYLTGYCNRYKYEPRIYLLLVLLRIHDRENAPEPETEAENRIREAEAFLGKEVFTGAWRSVLMLIKPAVRAYVKTGENNGYTG